MRWHIIHKAETESTNDDARGGAPWDVYTADWQSAGRGRLDHKWHSRSGENLIMSAVLDVAGLDPAHVATLPLAVGLAVCRAAKRLGAASAKIKWPNDILCGEKKLSGILCELNGACAVAGIGMNVASVEFPPEIAGAATSLVLETGTALSVADARDAVLDELAAIYPVWRRDGFSALHAEISSLDAMRGLDVCVMRTDDDAECVSGVCGGIAPDGTLDVAGEAIWAGSVIARRPGAGR